MSNTDQCWLAELEAGNAAFRRGADPARLPVARTPGQRALVTCMDPRVNLTALGVAAFDADGAGHSDVRVIRTIGGIAEERSLLVGIHLAGIREIAVVMHTDCGNMLAKQRIAGIVASLQQNTREVDRRRLHAITGAPDAERVSCYLHAFDDPYAAVREEVERIAHHPFVPDDVVVHGLVYELAEARLVRVVDGY